MASEKITAMPNLAGGQVPTDLIPAVDISALPASQNVKTTLNDLFSTVTKNITDRAVRFQAAGSTPGLSTPTTGALYFDGLTFQASQNGGAWTALVLAGSITTSGLTQNTARILGRTTAGTGAIEEISIGSGLALAAGSLAASGLLTASGYTQNSGFLIGRSTAGVGAVEEITIGSNLSLVGGVLSATGGGGTPGGSTNDVQYHASGGTFGGSNNFQFKITGAPTVGILATSAGHQVLTVRGDAAQTAEIVQVVQGGDNAAALLTLQQGVLSSLTSNFPFRYESAGGTLILGLRARPATGTYQFVSPGAKLGTVVYEVGTLGSNNGLGLATGSQSPSMFAGNIQCVWWSGYTGNTVINQAYQLTFGSGPASADVGLSRLSAGVLRLTNGSSTSAQFVIGTNSQTATGQVSIYSQAAGRQAAWIQGADGSDVESVVAVVTGTISNAATTPVLSLRARSTGVKADGFGGTLSLQAGTTAVTDVPAANIVWSWTNATHATRSAQLQFSVNDFASTRVGLEITPAYTRVPSNFLYTPALPGATATQLGQFFGDGSQLYGTFQSATLAGQSYIFFGTNRWSGAGAWYATGFDSSRPGNMMIMSGSGTNATFTLFYFPGSSLSPQSYAAFDRPLTSDDIGLSVWDGSAATTKRVTRGAADSGGTGFRVLRIPN